MKFYEDKTYIEMCRGAGEIQEQCPDIDDAKSFWIDIENNPYNHNIWLPRLDQLIEMAEPLPRLYSHTLLWELARWEDEYSADMVCPYTGSWETLILGYIMENGYKKKWDFEKKDWAKA
jgi:hypothetical protein